MSDSRDADPFDPVPVEDKVEEYQRTPQPEPDEERQVHEADPDPEAPLDARAVDDDERDPEEDPARAEPEEFPEV